MSNRKTTNGFILPSVSKSQPKTAFSLPFNGNVVTDKHFTFSFSCFDRNNDLFNLGSESKKSFINSDWFIELLECLKSISNMTTYEAQTSIHDMHRIDWTKTNVSMPPNSTQCDYWQFRLDKSSGRVIGIFIDNVFYVVWLDPYHNLTNSEGYGKCKYYPKALTSYEKIKNENNTLKHELVRFKEELQAYKELYD